MILRYIWQDDDWFRHGWYESDPKGPHTTRQATARYFKKMRGRKWTFHVVVPGKWWVACPNGSYTDRVALFLLS